MTMWRFYIQYFGYLCAGDDFDAVLDGTLVLWHRESGLWEPCRPTAPILEFGTFDRFTTAGYAAWIDGFVQRQAVESGTERTGSPPDRCQKSNLGPKT